MKGRGRVTEVRLSGPQVGRAARRTWRPAPLVNRADWARVPAWHRLSLSGDRRPAHVLTVVTRPSPLRHRGIWDLPSTRADLAGTVSRRSSSPLLVWSPKPITTEENRPRKAGSLIQHL